MGSAFHYPCPCLCAAKVEPRTLTFARMVQSSTKEANAMTPVITISMIAPRKLETSLPDMPVDEDVITTDNQIARGTVSKTVNRQTSVQRCVDV